MKNHAIFAVFILILCVYLGSVSCLAFDTGGLLQKPVKDTTISAKSLVDINHEIKPLLDLISQDEFFRYFKVNLRKKCLFWKSNMQCSDKHCSVESEKNNTETAVKLDNDLGKIEYFDYKPRQYKCDVKKTDFCVLDDESDSKCLYVDLIKNPERYTGYSGESANRIWRAIYEQNCMEFLYKNEQKPSSIDSAETDKLSVEKRTFYRVISGMHASISIHLCNNYYDDQTKKWGSNLTCYQERVGNHPDRIDNLYFLYSLMLQAVAKLDTYFDRFTYNIANATQDAITKQQIMSATAKISYNKFVPVETMFQDGDNLKAEFKEKFQNISQIIDCVACEKCKLWGKIQVSGIGTALKILFSFDPRTSTFVQPGELFNAETASTEATFKPNEISTLVNALHKFSESVEAIEKFSGGNQQQQPASDACE